MTLRKTAKIKLFAVEFLAMCTIKCDCLCFLSIGVFFFLFLCGIDFRIKGKENKIGGNFCSLPFAVTSCLTSLMPSVS